MSDCRVSFFKNLINSDGRQFKCLQQQIDIPDMESVDRAVESASRRFETIHGLRDWKMIADSIEIEFADRT